jgi:hypothetical protein
MIPATPCNVSSPAASTSLPGRIGSRYCNVPELSSLIERLQAYLQSQATSILNNDEMFDGYVVPSSAAEQITQRGSMDENILAFEQEQRQTHP